MLFKEDEEFELQPKRTKTLLISLGIHAILLIIVALNPDLLTSTPKRIIRIMGQDYDLSKQQLTELIVPPDALRARPAPAPPDKPLVQPPVPRPENQPAPPPPQQQPPPPPPPQTPPPVIGPDDVLKEGARPDAQPKASRGDTPEQARAGSQQRDEPKPEPPKQQPQQLAENRIPQLGQNTNPNALRPPTLLDSAGRIVQQEIDKNRKQYPQGPHTGVANGQEDPNFSTEEPTILSDTKGYDFGPYMNQVINRVRFNWYSLIPEIARLGKKGRVVITFTITQGGFVENALIRANSGVDPLDRAAFGAITASNPFAKLPSGFDGDHLVLQFTFLYNIR
jgi:TonB family protein